MKIWPMGAKKTPDTRKLNDMMTNDLYGAQEKFDGIRVICRILDNGVPKFTTRGSTLEDPDTPIDISHRLGHIFGGRVFPSIAGTVFDGEMYDPNQTSQQVAGQLNHRSTVSVSEDIKFYIFDLLAFKGSGLMDKPLRFRLEVLSKFHHPFGIYNVVFPPMYYGTSAKVELLHSLMAQGKEGIVLKNMNSHYYQGAKKANTWYKVKKFSDQDVVITGAEPPEKYYTDPRSGVQDLGRLTKPYERGWFGSVSYEFEELTHNGVMKRVGTVAGFSDEERETMSDGNHGIKPEYIGRLMELRYMQRTTDGNLQSPRFMRLRDPIDIKV